MSDQWNEKARVTLASFGNECNKFPVDCECTGSDDNPCLGEVAAIAAALRDAAGDERAQFSALGIPRSVDEFAAAVAAHVSQEQARIVALARQRAAESSGEMRGTLLAFAHEIAPRGKYGLDPGEMVRPS